MTEASTTNAVEIKLVVPTIFADLNKANGLEENHLSTTLKVNRLKFGHFRKMQSVPEEAQMIYAMSLLTGLSEHDIDELDAEDAAEITGVVYGFMSKYMQLAQKMASTMS